MYDNYILVVLLLMKGKKFINDMDKYCEIGLSRRR